jgi:hypothetical protein
MKKMIKKSILIFFVLNCVCVNNIFSEATVALKENEALFESSKVNQEDMSNNSIEKNDPTIGKKVGVVVDSGINSGRYYLAYAIVKLLNFFKTIKQYTSGMVKTGLEYGNKIIHYTLGKADEVTVWAHKTAGE